MNYAITNPLDEADTIHNLAKVTLIASAVAMLIGTVVARIGSAEAAATAAGGTYASLPGQTMSDVGAWTIFASSLAACASIGALIGVKANGAVGAAIGAGIGVVVLGLPISLITTMILSNQAP